MAGGQSSIAHFLESRGCFSPVSLSHTLPLSQPASQTSNIPHPPTLHPPPPPTVCYLLGSPLDTAVPYVSDQRHLSLSPLTCVSHLCKDTTQSPHPGHPQCFLSVMES